MEYTCLFSKFEADKRYTTKAMSLKLKYGISNIIVFFISKKKNSIIIINLLNGYSISRMLTYGEHYFVCNDFNE